MTYQPSVNLRAIFNKGFLMLSLSVKVGQAVQLGEHGYIRVEDKYGRNVKLVFATTISPIKLIATGIIPPEFTTGIAKPRELRTA